MKKDTKIILTGARVYNILKLSQVIAQAAVIKGIEVKTAEFTNEPLMVKEVVHVKIGKEVISPLISRNKADIIICFEPLSAVDAALSYLSGDGILLINSHSFFTMPYNLNKITSLCKEISPRIHVLNFLNFSNPPFGISTINFSVLGLLMGSGYLPLGQRIIINAIKDVSSPEESDMHIAALNAGAKMAHDCMIWKY
jgi:indolepyruvate ferredoxin oxidoreductase, beta subunit